MVKQVFAGNLHGSLGNFTLNTGDFEIPLEGITVLFGRSGSGKSTLLRALAGLEPSIKGKLSFHNQAWLQGKKSLPTAKRNIGFVFQDAALFPHKTVLQNLNYATKRLPKTQTPANFDFIVERIGISDKLNRTVDTLSGGEKQRVAIARALLMKPDLLFMDEPLSALDWRAKAQMLNLIEDVVAEFQIPALYITHSPAEVERLANQIVFMQAGKIERIETLQQALSRADSPLFDQGAVSVLNGEPGLVAEGLQRIKLGEQEVWITPLAKTQTQKPTIRLRMLARDISLALNEPKDISIQNQLQTKILELLPQTDHKVLVRLELADKQQVFAELTEFSANKLKLQPGLVVYALIKSVALAE